MDIKIGDNIKTVIIVIVSIIVVIILLLVGLKQYEGYKYDMKLKQVQAQYNEKQKECVVVGTTNNYIYVTRTDENKEIIVGSKWKVTSYDGTQIGTFETNSRGNGGLVGLECGEYYLEEISVPENYTKKENRYRIILSTYDTSYTLTKTDSKDLGSLIISLTNENEEPVEGINFWLYNSNDEKVIEATTKENGMTKITNLVDGIYYVQESDNKKAKKYSVCIQDSSLERVDIVYGEEE